MEAIWYIKLNILKSKAWFYYENLKFQIFDVAFLILLSVVTDQGVDELINFWTYSVNFRLRYSPFLDTGILYRNNLLNEISEEPLWLGSS